MATKRYSALDMQGFEILNPVFHYVTDAEEAAMTDVQDYQYIFNTDSRELKYWNPEKLPQAGWDSLTSAGAMTFIGDVKASDGLPAYTGSNIKVGDTYIVSEAGEFTFFDKGASKTVDPAGLGDVFICNKIDTTNNRAEWSYVPSANDSYSEEITGDGTKTEFTLAPSFNLIRPTAVTLYEADGNICYTDVNYDSTAKSVTVTFGRAPAAGTKFTVAVSF